jgi:hypothetical protein
MDELEGSMEPDDEDEIEEVYIGKGKGKVQ